MKTLLLSAYAVLEFLKKSNLRVDYRDLTPGFLSVDNKIIPVWEVQKKDEIDYLALSGVWMPKEYDFSSITIGAIFHFSDGRKIILNDCDNYNKKYFIEEPEYAIGIRKQKPMIAEYEI